MRIVRGEPNRWREAGSLQRCLMLLAGLLATLVPASTLSGCVVVGASSRGGFFLWPGGFGLVVLILLLVFVLRRR